MKKRQIRVWMAGTVSLLLLLGGCGDRQAEEAGQQQEIQETEDSQVAEDEQMSKSVEAAVQTEGQDVGGEDDNEETESKTETGSEGPVTFTDDLEREITLTWSDGQPRRAAALIGSFADIWQLAGGEVAAAVNDAWESLDLGLGEDTVQLGSILEPDVEQLIVAGPDLVLASANMDAHLGLEDTLTQAGITVAYFDVSNFEEYLHMLDICTRLTGQSERYEEYGIKVQEQIDAARERADGSAPTVLFLRASSTNIKAKGSGDSVGGEILSDLGCVNLADQEESLLEDLSMEAIIAADPEYIFITAQGEEDAARECVKEQLMTSPAWSALSAVQNEKYYFLDKNLFFLKPNARWGEAYEELAEILYP